MGVARTVCIYMKSVKKRLVLLRKTCRWGECNNMVVESVIHVMGERACTMFTVSPVFC